jgi:glycerol-3-phosphate acyltransferase PlsY
VGTIVTWVVIAFCFRYSSRAALLAALFAPFATLLVMGWPSAVVVGVMSAFLVWRHRANIARLIAGTEPRLGAKKAPSAVSR